MDKNDLPENIRKQLNDLTNTLKIMFGEDDPLTKKAATVAEKFDQFIGTLTPAANDADDYTDEDGEAELPNIKELGTNPPEGTIAFTLNEEGEVEARTEIDEDTVAQMNEFITQVEQELDEKGIEPAGNLAEFKVSYTKETGEELTEKELQTILDYPLSKRGLAEFGKTHLTVVEDGETPATKIATFAVLEEGKIPLAALAYNIASYQGTVTIPGVGLVFAIGSV